MAIIIANMVTALVMYVQAGIILIYLGVIFGSIFLIVIVSLLLRKHYYFHLHHYVWAGLFLILCGYQHLYITILGAISSGIMIEGVSRWGFDNWWVPRNH